MWYNKGMECSICTLIVPISEMHKDGRRKDGVSDICEACFEKKSRERKRLDKKRYRQNPEVRIKYRAWQLKRYYGITQSEFDSMLSSQGGLCAACRADNPRWEKGWCVDHDHACCPTTPTCGKCVRGILCMPCNMTVGIMKENIEDILGVMNYLRNLQ